MSTWALSHTQATILFTAHEKACTSSKQLHKHLKKNPVTKSKAKAATKSKLALAGGNVKGDGLRIIAGWRIYHLSREREMINNQHNQDCHRLQNILKQLM